MDFVQNRKTELSSFKILILLQNKLSELLSCNGSFLAIFPFPDFYSEVI